MMNEHQILTKANHLSTMRRSNFVMRLLTEESAAAQPALAAAAEARNAGGHLR
jgi:hypothetical protein